MLLTVIVANVVDVQFNWAMEVATADLDESARRDALTGGYGNFYTIMGITALLFQLLATSRIHRRLGVGFAIGVAGLEPVWDQVGERDLDGRTMQVTAPAMADALAAAASLVQGETSQGTPVVWVEGCPLRVNEQASSRALLRAVQQDMFR